MITKELLKTRINYDPETGIVTKLPIGRPLWDKQNAGKHPTYKHNGYFQLRINNKLFFVHRLIWLYMTGEWPEVIDHIDGDKTNNKWNNLRSVTQFENTRNSKKNKNNTSGFSGIHFNKLDNVWESYIHLNYKKKHLGRFKRKKEAIEARRRAELEYGFHENHGRG